MRNRLLDRFRRRGQKLRNIWDTLYDLYCHMEEIKISGIDYFAEDENALVIFHKHKSDPAKLKKIREVLGPKCEDYFRFLEFYNGIIFGHWNVHYDGLPDQVITDARSMAGDGKIDKLPIAMYYADVCDMDGVVATRDREIPRDSLTPYYLSITGDVLIYSQGEPVLICHSFEEFMSECVLGPRYLEFGKKDASYRLLQRVIKDGDEDRREYFKKFGKHLDEDENPTHDPRIMTIKRRVDRDIARQIREQTKGLPAGTPIDFSLERDEKQEAAAKDGT